MGGVHPQGREASTILPRLPDPQTWSIDPRSGRARSSHCERKAAMRSSVAPTRRFPIPSARATATAWVAGGTAWLVAGSVRSAHGIRFDLAEGLWIAAHVLMLVGLLGLRGLQATGPGRTGTGGL